MEYKKYKLGEIASFTQGKQVDINEQFFVKKEGMKRFVRIVDYTNSNEPIRYVNNFGKRYYVSSDEVAMIRYGSQTAGMAVLGKDGIIANNLFKILINNEIALNKYIFYFLSQKYIFNYLRKSQSSSTMPAISFNIMNNLEIYIPSKDCQRKIVKILSDIDKKIELNNQINNNLYDFAMNYLNSLTEDDEVQLSEFGKIQGGYAFKSKDLKDEKTANRIIKIKNLKSEINVDIDNSQFVDDEVVLKIDKKFKLQKGNVTIAMTGAELGKTGFIYGKDNYYLNQRVGVVKGKDIKSELYLKILMLSNNFQLLLNSKGYGSAQPNISTSDIENVMIKNINKENLDAFYKTVYPIYNKIINNSEENKNLEQLRDTILPKLMNGEIDLDNIEI